MFRALLLAKQASHELKLLVHPSAVAPVRVGGRPIPDRVASAVLGFIFMYFMTAALLTFALLLPVAIVAFLAVVWGNSPQTTQSAGANVASAVNDPGFVPQGVWSDLPNFPNTTMDFGSTGTGPSVPLQLKRASAAAYPPNGKIYIFGGRHRNDGNDKPP